MDYKDVIKQIEATDSKFGSVVDDAQKRMLREVLTLTKDLELSNGRIMPTVGNLKLISKIKEKLNKAVVNKDYLSGVKDLLKSFEGIQTAQLGYFKTISEGKATQQKYDLVRGMAIENTAAQLTESGIDANVTSKLKDMLLRSVTSGGLYRDLVGEVSEFLSNTDKSPGALSRYAKTYTTTALNQFAGQTNKLMTEDSGAEWFRYVGSDIETTREFCDLMTDKDYFHVSEIPELLKGHIDGKKCEIYDKTKLPKGMIEGTNKDNFQVNCGGWGCRHQILPVLTFTVPKNLRDKFASEVNQEENKIISKNYDDAINNQTKWKNSITDEEKTAIRSYTKDANEFNNHLRNGVSTSDVIKSKIKIIENTLKTAPKYDGEVYRGVEFTKQSNYNSFISDLKIGNTYSDKGFLSTSLDKSVAFENMRRDQTQKILFNIKSKNGVPIEKVSFYGEEKEVLFNKNSNFKVSKIDDIETENISYKQITLIEL